MRVPPLSLAHVWHVNSSMLTHSVGSEQCHASGYTTSNTKWPSRSPKEASVIPWGSWDCSRPPQVAVDGNAMRMKNALGLQPLLPSYALGRGQRDKASLGATSELCGQGIGP